jgi:hypothetical protein
LGPHPQALSLAHPRSLRLKAVLNALVRHPQAVSLAHPRSRRLEAVLSALERPRLRFAGRLDSVAQSTHNRIGAKDLRRYPFVAEFIRFSL